MDIRNIKVGMKIRICEDPSLSITLHGALDGYKRKLAGSVQTVRRVSRETKRIYIISPDSDPYHRTISFDISDLKRVNSYLPSIKAELFNPEKLVIE